MEQFAIEESNTRQKDQIFLKGVLGKVPNWQTAMVRIFWGVWLIYTRSFEVADCVVLLVLEWDKTQKVNWLGNKSEHKSTFTLAFWGKITKKSSPIKLDRTG